MPKPLAFSFKQSKAESNSLFVRGVHNFFPHSNLSPRFDPLFTDGLSRRQIQTNWFARTKFRNFRPHRVAHVGVIADSRGGSHLLQSRFHYLRCAFCFGEGFAPEWPRAFNFLAFLLRGVFGVNSLQSKNGRDITHLFYLLNNESFPISRPWQTDIDMLWGADAGRRPCLARGSPGRASCGCSPPSQ